MRGKRGSNANAWKGDQAGIGPIHRWMDYNYGRPKLCEGEVCSGKSDIFEWALKKGKTYTHDRDAFLRLCRSCHRKYDLTQEKIDQAVRNLTWYKEKYEGKKYKRNVLPGIAKLGGETCKERMGREFYRAIGMKGLEKRYGKKYTE